MEQFLLDNLWIMPLVVLWCLPWSAVALWKAARNSHKAWFVVLFLLNSLAILEIVYIFWFSRKKTKKVSGQAYPAVDSKLES